MAAATAPPRPAIERPKSGTMDFPDAYDRKMKTWREDTMRQAAAEMNACRDLQRVGEYIRYLDGEWWRDRPDWRSHYYDNYLADQRVESIAALTDINPVMDISCSVTEYEQQAKICHNVMRHIWVMQSMDLALADLIDHALFGAGFWKILAYTPGVMDVSAHAMGTVVPIQMRGNKLQSSARVLFRSYESLNYFHLRFGRDKARGLERYGVGLAASTMGDRYARPDDIPEYQWNSLSPAMRRRMWLSRGGPQRGLYGSNIEPFPVIELQEIYDDDISYNDFGHPVLVKHPDLSVEEHNFHYIVNPGQRMFPRKRLVVFGGDKVMYDGPNPFWDGQYPFVQLQLNPCVWSPGGISKYRDLIPLVKSLNRLGAGVDETVMDAVNRTVVSRKGAVEPLMWDRFDPSRPKQKVLLNGTANPATDFRYMDAKQLPNYVEMWLRHMDSRIKTRGGQLDIDGLSRKRQVPGSDAVENMRDAMSGPFRLEGRRIETAMKEAAIMSVSRIFQFFTLSQRLRLLGEDGQTWQDYDYNAQSMIPSHMPKEDHWKLFSINVAQGSMHGSPEHQKKLLATRLRLSRDISLKSYYKMLNIGLNPEEEMEYLKAEQAELMPLPAGRAPRLSRGQRTGQPF